MITDPKIRPDHLRRQAVVYVREDGQGPALQKNGLQKNDLQKHDRPLIDVNALAPDGTIALDWWYPSEDGRYVAFGTSPNGSG